MSNHKRRRFKGAKKQAGAADEPEFPELADMSDDELLQRFDEATTQVEALTAAAAERARRGAFPNLSDEELIAGWRALKAANGEVVESDEQRAARYEREHAAACEAGAKQRPLPPTAESESDEPDPMKPPVVPLPLPTAQERRRAWDAEQNTKMREAVTEEQERLRVEDEVDRDFNNRMRDKGTYDGPMLGDLLKERNG